MKTIRETGTIAISGWLVLALVIGAIIYGAYNFPDLIDMWRATGFEGTPVPLIIAFVVFIFVILPSFVINNPNESRVLLFFGRYIGTLRGTGFYWVIPFTSRQVISRRVVSLNTKTIKVNDLRGNPIEIGAVIVWNVEDSAKAALNVDNYHDFVAVQSETAVRTLASRLPYDSEDGDESLRGSPDNILYRKCSIKTQLPRFPNLILRLDSFSPNQPTCPLGKPLTILSLIQHCGDNIEPGPAGDAEPNRDISDCRVWVRPFESHFTNLDATTLDRRTYPLEAGSG